MMDQSDDSTSTPAATSVESAASPQSSNTSSSLWHSAEFTLGVHYHARAYTDQVWDLAKLLRIIGDGSAQQACVQWSLSGLEQIIPLTADTLRAVPGKRERKCVHDLADDENALRTAIGMRKMCASSAQKKMKKERRPVEDGHRKASTQKGSLTIELIRSAEAKSMQCLSGHAEELKPFVTKKTYRSLQSALALSSPCERDRPFSSSCEREVPKAIRATLRKYQVEGLSWLVDRYDSGINCVLADEMGLGKTLQTIAFLAYLQEVRRDTGPHLVVVPMSVMFNWVAECRKFCPSLRLLRLHSTHPAECFRLRNQLQDATGYDVAITTYEMLKGSLETAFHRMIWRSLVLDEGHRIKNPETFLSKTCMKLRSRFKLILTGTPVQNDLREIFSLLHFLNPHVFQADCAPLFGACFSLTPKRSDGSAATADKVGNSSIPSEAPQADADRSAIDQPTIDRSLLDAAHYMMRPFILRRIKTEVEHSLPPKLETLIRCPLSKVQRLMIRGLLLKDGALIDQHLGSGASSSDGKSTDWKHLQSLVAQLRKASNHPYLFAGVESSAAGPAKEDVVTSSGKMVVLDLLLRRLKLRGHRVVLFSQYTRTLDIIGDYLDLRGYSHCRLDGSTNRVMREVLINQFNKENSPLFVFCLSTRAGGEGVNLFTADTVVLFDSDWNPQVDIQAMARVHRIGQTRPVHVYRLVSRGTVEERIVQRAQKKLFLDCMVNRGSTAKGLEIDRKLSEAKQLPVDNATDGDVDISTVMSALKFGWNACFGADNDFNDAEEYAASYMSDEAVDAIIDRTRLSNSSLSGVLTDEGGGGGRASSRTRQLVGLQEDQEQSASFFEEAAPLVSIRSFEGEVFSRESKEVTMSDISSQWIIDKPPGQMRERESRLEQVLVRDVGLVSVLKMNNYSLEQGEPSVFEKEGKKYKRDPTGGGKKRPRCFENQDHCQRCWNYGTLVCCNHCPASYHPACDGMKKVPSFNWSCPHHRGCVICRKTNSSTGFLFRCEMCPDAYCEDCLPLDYAFIGRNCERWEELGFAAPSNACFIHCGADCVAFAAKQRIEGNGSVN